MRFAFAVLASCILYNARQVPADQSKHVHGFDDALSEIPAAFTLHPMSSADASPTYPGGQSSTVNITRRRDFHSTRGSSKNFLQTPNSVAASTSSGGVISTLAGRGIPGYGGDGGQAVFAELNYPSFVAVDSSTGNLYIADGGNNCVRMVTKSTSIIITIAGNGSLLIGNYGYESSAGYSGDGGLATLATMNNPSGLAIDATRGLLYIADMQNNLIRMVTRSTGIIVTVAGRTSGGYRGDGGRATFALLLQPMRVAVDISTGNLYIADSGNNVIRMVTKSTGIISTVAGVAAYGPGYGGDGGPATSAQLYFPTGIAVDASNGNLYIADTTNNVVRMVASNTGIIITVAGSGQAGSKGDGGPATTASLLRPYGVAIDALKGILYIADAGNNVIRMVTKSTGIITTIVGSGRRGYEGDGKLARNAMLNQPFGVTIDTTSGTMYIADTFNNVIRNATGSASAPSGPSASPITSPSTAVTFAPTMSPASAGTSIVGTIFTYAGNGTPGYSGDGGAATSASLNVPTGVAVDTLTGNIYIADDVNNVVRIVTKSTGIISTVAGTGVAGYSGDNGPATRATLSNPRGVACDPATANIYIADSGNYVIRMIKKDTGVITTFAGIGNYGYSGDGGQALSASIGPAGCAVDPITGNLYIVSQGNAAVRMVTTSTGIITTVAGNGNGTFTGGSRPATSAILSFPSGVAVEAATGNFYIADTGNNILCMVTKSTGIISTVAGKVSRSNGNNAGYTGDGGQAVLARLNTPLGVAVDTISGDIYIADTGNYVIRMIKKSTGVITTVAGNGNFGYNGDGGRAISAALSNPGGVAFDASSGTMYIADTYNNVIRKVIGSASAPSGPSASPIARPSTAVTFAPTMAPASAGTSIVGTIFTYAGNGAAGYSGDGGAATSASLNVPTGVAVDTLTGNIYIADDVNNVVRIVTKSTGIISTAAGTGVAGYSGDNGPATRATLSNPIGVAVDVNARILYIASASNNVIRAVMIDTGIITTVAGYFGGSGYSGDGGQATSATLSQPMRVAVDISTGNLYIADAGNNVIRMVTKSTGIISTVAGNAANGPGYGGDGGPATSAQLFSPIGIAVDASNGNLYIADYINNVVRMVTKSTGIISTIAGNAAMGPGYTGDGGQATAATLNYPIGLAVDAVKGVIYISDLYNNVIRMVTKSTGIITTVIGNGMRGYGGDGGQATSATLSYPYSVAIDTASGMMYIADTYNNVIRKVIGSASAPSGPSASPIARPSTAVTFAPTMAPASAGTSIVGTIFTYAGNGAAGYSGDGGAATSASLNVPTGVAVDTLTGNIYIADDVNNVVRIVTKSTGIISTVAGTGVAGYTGDNGPATRATLSNPIGVAVDVNARILYIASVSNNVVRAVMIDTGIITTVAGYFGGSGYSGDGGQATSATLSQPMRVAVDISTGNLYIADAGNNVIRMVTKSTGIISTVAGNAANGPGYGGDGGPATSAQLYLPTGIAVDASNGNLYIADYINNVVRMVTKSTGIISTIAGNAAMGPGYTGDGGQATAATLNYPIGLAVDAVKGVIYISDLYNNVIRMVTKSTGIITTVIGNGMRGYGGDGGQATSATLSYPYSVAIDTTSGMMYIADTYNYVIRNVIGSASAPSGPSASPIARPSTAVTFAPTMAPASAGTSIVGTIFTYAGNGAAGYSGDGGAATSASLNVPTGVAVDTLTGNIYIADDVNNVVRIVTKSTGIISTAAGTGVAGYSGDNGPATRATLSNPVGVAVDVNARILYIASVSNNVVRAVMIDTGIITTVAGYFGGSGYSGDGGQATSATLSQPMRVAVDISTGNLYIADAGNNVIRMVTKSTGIISTVAGNAANGPGYGGDGGPATSAQLYLPTGVAVDASNGNLYIADSGNSVIRMVTKSTGIISTIAGNAAMGSGYTGDGGQATAATLSFPTGLAVDAVKGVVYISDLYNNVIRMVTKSTGIITTVVGNGMRGYGGDGGQATSATLSSPYSVAIDTTSGMMYIADTYNNVIRNVIGSASAPSGPSASPIARPSTAVTFAPTMAPASAGTSIVGTIFTYAGNGAVGYSGDGGAATSATMFLPTGVAVDTLTGNMYIADDANNVVRIVTKSTGIISTAAGTGVAGYTGDNGPATRATLSNPVGVAVDVNARILYIASVSNNVVRAVMIDTGIITTVAGYFGGSGYSGDGGQATSANLSQPMRVAVDISTGNLYIADAGNNVIRMVTKSTGIISTVAGNAANGPGYGGDGGPATSAQLFSPIGIAVDASNGNLYIADSGNNVVRMVTKSTGIISTIAGNAAMGSGYTGDGGQATAATLSFPTGLAVDAVKGVVYIADAGNNVIRMVTKSTGIITTVVGNGMRGYGGDGGQATSATLSYPYSVAIDTTSGTMYIADLFNFVIRNVIGSASAPSGPSASPIARPSTAVTFAPTMSPTSAGTSIVGTIFTYAGNGAAGYSGDGGAATSASLNVPTGVAVDTLTGNMYIADDVNNVVRIVTKSTGIISTVAGIGVAGYTGDNGPATRATLSNPVGVAVDVNARILYIASASNNVIRAVMIDTGIITTVAGYFGGSGYSGDGGQATSANLSQPVRVAVDISTGNLYIADAGNNVIRMVTKSTGIISTVAGNAANGPGYGGDGGPATSAQLFSPTGIAVDASNGNLYIADTANNVVRMVTKSTGIISTIAGNAAMGPGYTGDGGQATAATLSYPIGLAVDAVKGVVYIADAGNNVIRMVTKSTGIITTVVGNGMSGYGGDGGQATSATLSSPYSVAIDTTSGMMYIADTYNNVIRNVIGSASAPSGPSASPIARPSTAVTFAPTMAPASAGTSIVGTIFTYAGNGAVGYSGDGGAATSASLNVPTGVAVDTLTGNIYIADDVNNVVRIVTKSTGIISTAAGTGVAGYTGDNGPATRATLSNPVGVAVDVNARILYIASASNNVVRAVMIDTGIITTVAGYFGGSGYSGDGGQAASATLSQPMRVAVDISTGNLYIADAGNNVIRMVTKSTGIISTVAGNAANGPGYGGDGGPATSAQLFSPTGIAVDASNGNLYIADYINNVVRMVTKSTGIISTIAGNAAMGSGYTGDGGQATAATLSFPTGLAVDAVKGVVYIADAGNNVIRMVTKSTGIITTVVGNGMSGYGGDGGQATSATLSLPNSVAIDTASGTMYIADTYNNVIRNVIGSASAPSGPSASPIARPSTAVTFAPTMAPASAALQISTLAGSGVAGYNGDGGYAASADMFYPSGLGINYANGNIYISDSLNQRVRMVDRVTGIISTVAGTGLYGFGGDKGLAVNAMLNNPAGIAVHSTSGHVYIADTFNHRIRMVNGTTGIIITVAGTGGYGYSGQGGPATSALLNRPSGVCLDSRGNMFISDTGNFRLRMVSKMTGFITTIAGTGKGGFTGDLGQASSAAISRTLRSIVDPSTGAIYIADSNNHRIRMVAPRTGVISTVAGNGLAGYSGDGGLATAAQLYEPSALSLDSQGNLFIADTYNNCIRKVIKSTGVIVTVAGVGNIAAGYGGDGGPATAGLLSRPLGIIVDTRSGTIYISDTYNSRVREVKYAAAVHPTQRKREKEALSRGTIAIIVGAIIGGVFVVILGLLLCVCYCKPAKKEIIEESVPSPMMADENLENASRGTI